MDKYEQLKQKIDEAKTKSLVMGEMKAFAELLISATRKTKEELANLSAENIQTIKDSIAYIEEFHNKQVNILKDEKKSMVGQFDENIALLKSLIKKVKTIKPKDGKPGKDADEEVIVEKVLEKIQLPEQKEIILDDGEAIADKLEALEGDKKLDFKALKNVPEFKSGKSGGVRNIYQMGDVSLTNLTDNDVLKWDDTNKLWVNGTDSGGGGGMVIGENVSGADANVILFTDDSGNLAQDTGKFEYFIDKEASGQNYFHIGETNPLTWIENYRGDLISNLDGYAGYAFSNLSADSTASVDFILNNDQTTETTHYVDIGFNSSTFDDVTYPAWNQPDRSYYYNTDQGISFGGFFNGAETAPEITQTFTSSEIDTGTDEITVTSANNLYNGARVVLSTSGSAPGGLTAGTTYFIINTNTDGIGGTVIKLASTLANSLIGTAINITSGGTGTHTLTLESSLFDFMGNGQGRDKVYLSIMKDGDIVARNINNGVVYGLDARSDASLAVAIGIGVNASAVSSGAIGANFQNNVTNTLGIGWGTKAMSINASGAVTMTQSGDTTTLTVNCSRSGTTAYGAQIVKTGASKTGVGLRVKASGATNNTSLLIGDTTGSGNYGVYQDDTSLSNFFGGTITVPQIYNTPNAVTASGNAATVSRTSRNHVVTNNSASGLTITLSTTGASAGDMIKVKSLPSSAVAQTITWVNTENSDITPSANLNASTTSPRTDGFEWNPLTSKWRCIASC